MRKLHWSKFWMFLFALGLPIGICGASPGGASAQPTTLRALYQLTPPRAVSSARTAVVLVDFQNEFVNGRLPLPEGRTAIERARELSKWAHKAGVLVVMVRNVIRRQGGLLFAPGSSTTEFVRDLQPEAKDLVVEKAMIGAFSRTNLDAELRARGIDTLIVGGFMTHLAVASTASDGTVLGYHVIVAADATATRALPGTAGAPPVDAKLLKRAALAAMADRVADVMLTRDVMALPIVP
jgi:nicotinamidase-related amidase